MKPFRLRDVLDSTGAVPLAGKVEGTVLGVSTDTRSLEADRDTQSLQVLEGNSGFIRTGQAIPVPQSPFAGAIINGQFVGRANRGVDRLLLIAPDHGTDAQGARGGQVWNVELGFEGTHLAGLIFASQNAQGVVAGIER